MQIFKKITPLKKHIKNLKTAKKTIGFVPTMGAIHQGHLSLIKTAREKSDIVIASIFVNPKQFNNQKDYAKYPQTLKSDIKKFKAAKVDILFIPDLTEIYPQNFITNIKLDKITETLCGKTRPGHFDGVALIVTKLFNIVTPDLAIFGQKDFQQLQIIKRLVLDLNLNIKIIAAKIIREKSGLSLSSRNLRLDDKAQKIASEIYQILSKIKQQILQNPKISLEKIIDQAKKDLLKNGFEKIDYLEICDEENLQPMTKFDPKIKSRIFIAVYLHEVRLIDNIQLY